MPKLRIGFSDESELNLELEFETEEQQNEYIDIIYLPVLVFMKPVVCGLLIS